jgi:uncharacterized repeat protein (TIGR03803 family)
MIALRAKVCVSRRPFQWITCQAISLLVLAGLPSQLRAWDLRLIASFSGANGATPYAGVTLNSQGNLFGTTLNGGMYNDGVAWEIVKGGRTITTLASFSSPITNVGTGPYAGVTLDAQGNLYGTTAFGGYADYGNVWEIKKGSGTISELAVFFYTNGGHPYAGLTIDTQGNLFGVATDGDRPTNLTRAQPSRSAVRTTRSPRLPHSLARRVKIPGPRRSWMRKAIFTERPSKKAVAPPRCGRSPRAAASSPRSFHSLGSTRPA